MEWRRKKLFYSKIMKKGPFCRISNFVLAKDPDIIICMRLLQWHTILLPLYKSKEAWS
jgi:hypothetical protein